MTTLSLSLRLPDLPSCTAAQHNGRILVARESAAAPGAVTEMSTGTGELVDMWEAISSPNAVQTPAEVYATLRAEGLPVRYLRVPVTDGRAPHPVDIDAIILQVGAMHGAMLAGPLLQPVQAVRQGLQCEMRA